MVTPTAALTPATLLDPQLEAQSINLASLNDGTLSYFDEQRRLTQSPSARYVRLTLDQTPASVDATGGLIELVDGQRLAGRWAGAARDGEALVWDHPELGRFTLGLDDVRLVVVNRAAQADDTRMGADLGTAEGDAVELINGDRLVGFIVAVGEDAVTILPDGAAEEVTLSRDTVAGLVLANPALSPGDAVVAGDLIELVDGSRVRGGGVAIQRESFTFTPSLADAMQPVEMELSRVRRIDFAAAGLRLVELGEQPMTTEAGGTVFGVDMPPRVDGAGIRLHAPVTVSFELPEGTQRLSATAALDLPVGLSDKRAGWADLELSIDGPATPSQPTRLWAQQPERRLNLTLDGADHLRIDVDPSKNGPVLDRLLLRDALLLIEVTDPRPGSGDAGR